TLTLREQHETLAGRDQPLPEQGEIPSALDGNTKPAPRRDMHRIERMRQVAGTLCPPNNHSLPQGDADTLPDARAVVADDCVKIVMEGEAMRNTSGASSPGRNGRSDLV